MPLDVLQHVTGRFNKCSDSALIFLLQEKSLLAVAGKVVKGGLPVLMNCPDTGEPTRVRRSLPVPCVTGGS
jgi:hypothetical protein